MGPPFLSMKQSPGRSPQERYYAVQVRLVSMGSRARYGQTLQGWRKIDPPIQFGSLRTSLWIAAFDRPDAPSAEHDI